MRLRLTNGLFKCLKKNDICMHFIHLRFAVTDVCWEVSSNIISQIQWSGNIISCQKQHLECMRVLICWLTERESEVVQCARLGPAVLAHNAFFCIERLTCPCNSFVYQTCSFNFD